MFLSHKPVAARRMEISNSNAREACAGITKFPIIFNRAFALSFEVRDSHLWRGSLLAGRQGI